MKTYPQTHQRGVISLENIPPGLSIPGYMKGDLGIQIAEDGRVWVCIDGAAFLRFSPHPNGRMGRRENETLSTKPNESEDNRVQT